MSAHIRPYEPADRHATRRVFEAAVRGTASAYYSAEQIRAWCPDEYDECGWHERRARAWTIVAVLDGEIVGFTDLTDDGELDMLFVAPSAGGRGVARMLVDAVLAHARERGFATVTTRASRAARPAFERFGFVAVRSHDDNVIRGVVVPNVSMHRDLV